MATVEGAEMGAQEGDAPPSRNGENVLSGGPGGRTLVPQIILEGLLFVSGEPLSIPMMQAVLPEAAPQDIKRWVDLLNRSYKESGRAFEIVQVAGGYQLVTREELSPWLEALSASRQAAPLTRSAMETLAIVAYRQPVSRAEVEQIRGVDSHSVLRTLMARGVVKVCGRGKGPGRPLLFATTRVFLEQFGLHDLRDLPSEDEVEQLVEKSLAQTEDAAYLRGPEVR
jgi:segregation and condensation protein B